MADEKPPLMFWIVATIGLLWNLIGCWNYMLQTNSEVVSQMPEAYRLIVENRPAWVTAGFAVSVFGGAVGAILLLLRRQVATAIFALSLIGTLAPFYLSVRVLGFDPATGSALLMAIALLWFASLAAKRGWTR